MELMEHIKTAFSSERTVKRVTEDLNSKLGDFQPEFILYFASSSYEQELLAESIKKAFGSAEVIGSSTSGEITSGKMLEDSVVLMAFDKSMLEDYKVEVVKDITTKHEKNISNAFQSIERHFNTSAQELSHEEYLGIVMIDGLSISEEKVMDKVGDLSNLPFIGGAAGDDMRFKETHVYHNGRAISDAAVLAVLKPKTKFSILKTQSFVPLDTKFVATKVNEETREVVEFNGKPAVDAYAEALGVPVERIEEYFMSNPVGLMSGEQIFVRSPQQTKGKSIVFFCNILEGMEVTLLQTTLIVPDTKKAIEQKRKELGGISGIINFHCILRTLQLKNDNLTKQYGEIFTDIPTVGLSTYGEQYLGHINQTSTMIVFK